MNNTPRIAIVHDFLLKVGGAEKVLLSLLELFPDAPIYTLLYDEAGTKGLFKDREIIMSSLQKKPRFMKRKLGLLLSKFPQAIEEFNFNEFDIIISNSNSFAHGVISSPKTFHLCYCHSPMRYTWDWYFEYLEEHSLRFSPIGIYARNVLSKIRIWDKLSASRVDYWLANSKNVKDRIKKYYKTEAEIVYPPIEVNKISVAENLPDDYYIIVSRLEPYKKIDLAIKAFNKLEKQLLIIGVGSQEKELKSIASQNIEFLGWQSDNSLYEYLANAKALIFPGEEDFGLTPIEAMASGRPVIAFKKGGVCESVVNNKTGIFFNEQTEESLIKAIGQLESTYVNFSPYDCRKRSEDFSADNFKVTFKKIVDKEFAKYKEAYEKDRYFRH